MTTADLARGRTPTILSPQTPHTAVDLTPPWRGDTPRIAHVATRYLRGGSERRIRDMVRAFPEAEHHLMVGAESDMDLAARQVGPASVTMVATLVRQPHPYRDLVALRRLVGLMREDRFDLVVTHQSKAGILGRTAARMRGVPVIHSLSMPSFGAGYPPWQTRLFRAMERRLARSTDAYAVVGNDVSFRYQEVGVPADKLHVVRSGVSLPRQSGANADEEVRRTYQLPTERPLVLYLGSLEARKGVLDLPRFLALLVSTSPGACPHLVIAGEGPLSAALRRGFERAGVSHAATLIGFVSDPLPLIAAASSVILPSSAEGVPQVLVQAAAFGTPFVAYNVDGVRELIDLGARGVVIVPGDVAGAASATLSIIRFPTGSKAPTTDLTEWEPNTIRRQYRSLFLDVLGIEGDVVAAVAEGPSDG